MNNSKGAILALTRKGADTGIELARHLPDSMIYLPEKLLASTGKDNQGIKFFQSWKQTVEVLFHNCSYLIFICATGITVRSISPYLQGKDKDPGVVVLDEDGQYAVSLLSGHLGGANKLAEKVAEILKGEAVITTATDRKGFSYPPDILAPLMEGFLEPPRLAKDINALMAEGDKVKLYCPFPLVEEIRKDYSWQGSPKDREVIEPALVVTPYRWDFSGKILGIKPSCLVAGVGCRKGVSLKSIRDALTITMQEHKLDPRCLKALATVDIKAEEGALKEYCQELKVPLEIFSREEIKALEGTFPESPRVKKILGVGGVCEPTARLAAGKGPTLVPKQTHGPVTVSVALARSWWWAWDPVTGSF